jgi:MFS family permease
MFRNTFTSFIVKSPDYYNIHSEQAGNVLGTIGFYAEIVIILSDLVLGAMMDHFGRKYPLIIGLIITGIAILVVPYGHSIYPYLLICRYVQFYINLTIY